eukprot:TRINITY_DN7014_c1_g1_i1.p1 TRINITY_DN7014_c1_g1~~TRINITY_DN7014_c1_g1_i1.p1  ORF type:complete len:527 (+),score=166.38 TRINITY_DN7014_c1_g1_i1:65-1645(+)
MGTQRPASVDKATDAVLQHLNEICGSRRAYIFHFRGNSMSNTHEAVRGVDPFLDKLSAMRSDDLPFFVSRLRLGESVMCSLSDIEGNEAAALEHAEMTAEAIQRLALVPINTSGLHSACAVGGFIGVDFCEDDSESCDREELLATLADVGAFIFKLQALYELGTGVSPVRAERGQAPTSGPSSYNKARMSHDILREIQTLHGELYELFAPHCVGAVPLQMPSESQRELAQLQSEHAWALMTPAQREAHEHFTANRWAELPPDVWYTEQCGVDEYESLRQVMLANLHSMDPDIPPYTAFRNVGYARYRYRNGAIYPLKHKGFFQIDPKVNVLLQSKSRPFARLTDELRDNATLCHMLQVLIERVWDGDLGQDVHVNVHPVRVRNFHENEIRQQAHATLEGTHTDSTMRVAVVLLERHNVRSGTAKTALYHPSAPMGLRRDVPEDEAVLAPKRLVDVELSAPLHAITFDDPLFKHDASDPRPADPNEKMWRCVLLIMCRYPCEQASPEDGHPIDGYTPRSARARETVA